MIAFETALSAGGVTDLQQAVDLASGPFLAGFALRDSSEFDEWQAMTADRLRDGLAGALGALTVAMAGRGDVGAALRHARARLALDPLSEPAHRDLMRALALAGDRPGALRQYRSLIRLLDRELGVPPLPETADLAAAIRRGEAPPWPGPTVSAAAQDARSASAARDTVGVRGDGGHPAGTTQAAGSGPTLFDRDDVLGDLMGAWRAAARAASVIGVTGEAGIGRTALLSELSRRAGHGGGLVLGVRGRESERHLALAALADLLAPAIGPGADPDVRGALAGLVELGVPDTLGPGAQRRRLAAIVSLLEATGSAGPTLIVIDDAHLLDPSSAEEMGYVLRRLPTGVCALVSWPTDRAGAGLPRMVRELESARVVRLDGLSVEAVAQLSGREGATDLWERTRGVPRLVLECVASADRDAADDLRALVAARLDRLSAEAMQVLAAAAVLGGPAEPDLLREVSGRDERGTVESIEEAMGHSLLIEVGTAYDLPHATLRTLVDERTTRARSGLLHRRAAQFLATHATARGVHPGVIARHYSDAAMPEAAAPWHERAAARAMGLRAHDEALAHLALAGDSAAIDSARGEVLIRLGRYDEAIAALEAALTTDDMNPGATAATLHRLADVHDRLGEWALAQERLRAAEEALGTSTGPLWARLRTDQALSSYRLGELSQARALAEEVTREETDPAEQARAWNLLGMVALAEGDPDSSLDACSRSVEMAARADTAEVTVAAWHNQSRALHLLGRIDEAQEAAEHARELAEQEADVHRIAVVESNLADILHAQGRTDEARALQTRSAEALARVALPHQRPEVWLIADW